MKITFLIQSLHIGGAERQLATLASELKNRGHDIQVLVFYAGGPLEQKLKENGIPIINLEKKGRYDIFWFLFRLYRYLQQNKPDILHGYLTISNLLCLIMKILFPSLPIIFGIRASNMELKDYDWMSLVANKLEAKLSRFANHIIVNSHAGLHYMESQHYQTKKTTVINNGIDTDYFKPDLELRKQQRANWGILDNECLIGLVGRLDPMKDHTTFLQAAAILSQDHPKMRFVCVGNGPLDYQIKLKKIAKDLNLEHKILWQAASDNVLATYNALDLLCSSSAYGEGFSNVIAEALSCGCPVVATRVGDAGEIIRNSNYVVEPRDSRAFAGSITSYCKELLDKALPLAVLPATPEIRKDIIERFSIEQMVASTENLFFNLV